MKTLCILVAVAGMLLPTFVRDPKSNFVRSCPKADKRGCGWIVR
jgi:hypothetical protein